MQDLDLLAFLDKVTRKKKMAKAKHIHQYERRDIGKKAPYYVYKCVLPNCPHYISEQLVVGRLSICHYCSEPFEVKQSDLRLVKPHCENCVNEIARSNALKRRNIQSQEPVAQGLGEALLDSIERAQKKPA
jgi:hypothetical protein